MNIAIMKDYKIAENLSMGIGGVISHFAFAYSEDDIQKLHRYSIQKGIPFCVLGGG